MAMNAVRLGLAIKAKVDALSASEKLDSTAVYKAQAEAIIDEIKNHAEIASLTQSGIIVTGAAAVAEQGATVSGQTGKIS
jgi:hypothetical protein